MAFAAVTAPALLALSQTKLFQQKDQEFQQKDQIQQVMFAASIPIQAMYLSNLSSTLYLKRNGELQNDAKMMRYYEHISRCYQMISVYRDFFPCPGAVW